MWSKEKHFCLKFNIFADIGKTRFAKVISKNFCCLDMLTFSETTFTKCSLKSSFFSKYWYFSTYGQKTFFLKRSKEKFLELAYFRRYGPKTIFSKWSQNINQNQYSELSSKVTLNSALIGIHFLEPGWKTFLLESY